MKGRKRLTFSRGLRFFEYTGLGLAHRRFIRLARISFGGSELRLRPRDSRTMVELEHSVGAQIQSGCKRIYDALLTYALMVASGLSTFLVGEIRYGPTLAGTMKVSA